MPKDRKKGEDNRTKEIIAWVHEVFGNYGGGSKLTAAQNARLCSRKLGRKISANTMARILRTCGVEFQSSPNDPMERSYSKMDILIRRMDLLEERVKKLEGKKK